MRGSSLDSRVRVQLQRTRQTRLEKLLYRTRESMGTRESKGGESTSPKGWTRSSTSREGRFTTVVRNKQNVASSIDWKRFADSFAPRQSAFSLIFDLSHLLAGGDLFHKPCANCMLSSERRFLVVPHVIHVQKSSSS